MMTTTTQAKANNPPSASPKHTAKRSRPINLDHVLFLGGVSPCNTGVDDLLGSAPAEHTPHHQPKPSLEADFTTMLNALVTTRERPSPNSVGKEAPGSPLPNSPLRQSPPRQSQRSMGSQPPAMLPPKPSPEPSAEQLPEEMHARWLQVLTAKKHALEQVQHMRAEALHALDSMRRMLIEATDRMVHDVEQHAEAEYQAMAQVGRRVAAKRRRVQQCHAAWRALAESACAPQVS